MSDVTASTGLASAADEGSGDSAGAGTAGSVTGTASPSAAHTPDRPSVSHDESRSERPQRGGRENPLPHWRHRELLEKRERELHDQYAARIADYERRLSGTPQHQDAPQPADLSRLFSGPDQRREIAGLRGEMRALHASTRFEGSWTAFQNTNRDVFEAPGAQEALRAAFAAAWKAGQDPARAVQDLAGQFRRFLHERRALAAARREEQRRPERRVVPGGRSGWAPSAGNSSPESGKHSVAAKIQARLQASRSEG